MENQAVLEWSGQSTPRGACRRAHRSADDQADAFVGLAVLAGVALTGMAIAVRRSAAQAQERHPPEGLFLEVGGARIHYFDLGTGSPVVLLHGNGSFASDFFGSGLVSALAERHRVIAFDRPGFGYSDRPRSQLWSAEAQARLLREALAALGLEKPLIVAHSWGTLVALAWALDDPDGVRGLALLSGYYYPTLRLDTFYNAIPAVPLVGDLMRYTISPLLGRVIAPLQIRSMFAPEAVPPAFRRAVPLHMMLRPWQLRATAAENAMLIVEASTLARRYPELRLPIALIAGGDDRVIDHQAQTLRLHHSLPHSRAVIIPGCGHMLHYSEPGMVAQVVEEMAAESESPEPARETTREAEVELAAAAGTVG